MKKSSSDSIVIRSWPKVMFLYPVMFTTLICGAVQWVADPGPENQGLRDTAGLIFFGVLCLNLMVISFEFSRFRTMSVVFFLFGVFFFLLYLSRDHDIFPALQEILSELSISMSTSFYFCLGIYFLIVFGVVYITTRFDYWEIKSNEILHKEGFLGDVRRFPSPNLRMSKEISDVFEFVLMGAGRIVLSPASEKQAIVLNHVLRVNAAEKKIQDLLSSLSVELQTEDDDQVVHGIGG